MARESINNRSPLETDDLYNQQHSRISTADKMSIWTSGSCFQAPICQKHHLMIHWFTESAAYARPSASYSSWSTRNTKRHRRPGHSTLQKTACIPIRYNPEADLKPVRKCKGIPKQHQNGSRRIPPATALIRCHEVNKKNRHQHWRCWCLIFVLKLCLLGMINRLSLTLLIIFDDTLTRKILIFYEI